MQTQLAGHGLALHGATLAQGGFAWVCVGARGAGKTTLARRYVTNPRLGDDYAVLEAEHAGFRAHGTPYTGREGTWSQPGDLPLRAIVLLKQANRLMATRLCRSDAFPLVLRHVIAADISQYGVSRRLRVLERLVSTVPVVNLEFRRNDDIWEPVMQAVGPAYWVEAR